MHVCCVHVSLCVYMTIWQARACYTSFERQGLSKKPERPNTEVERKAGICRVRQRSWRLPAVELDHEGPRSELSYYVELGYRSVREGMVRGMGGRPDAQIGRQADSKALEELEIPRLLVLDGRSNTGQYGLS